jgi:hypothetical protein
MRFLFVIVLCLYTYNTGFSLNGKRLYHQKSIQKKSAGKKDSLIVIPYYLDGYYGENFPRIWHYDTDGLSGSFSDIPRFETQCGGVGFLLLKGKFKNLDIYIKCKDGTTIVHESKVNVNGKKKVLIERYRKDLFSGCVEKYDEAGHSYSEYDVFIEDKGKVLFHGEVIRRECYE